MNKSIIDKFLEICKNLIKRTFLLQVWIVIFVIVYMGFAFVQMNGNVVSWEEGIRFGYVITSSIIGLFITMIHYGSS